GFETQLLRVLPEIKSDALANQRFAFGDVRHVVRRQLHAAILGEYRLQRPARKYDPITFDIRKPDLARLAALLQRHDARHRRRRWRRLSPSSLRERERHAKHLSVFRRKEASLRVDFIGHPAQATTHDLFA